MKTNKRRILGVIIFVMIFGNSVGTYAKTNVVHKDYDGIACSLTATCNSNSASAAVYLAAGNQTSLMLTFSYYDTWGVRCSAEREVEGRGSISLATGYFSNVRNAQVAYCNLYIDNRAHAVAYCAY